MIQPNELPLGVRYNNPFHIRDSDRNDWQGEVRKRPGEQRGYEHFQRPEDATRAFMIIMNSYRKRGLSTFKLIFAGDLGDPNTPLDDKPGYAPAADGNDPISYAKFVAKRCGMDWEKEGPILRDKECALKLCTAVVQMECGLQKPSGNPWYSETMYSTGIAMAYDHVKRWW